MTYMIDAKTPKGQAGQLLRAVNTEAKLAGCPRSARIIKEQVRRSDNKVVNHWKVTWGDGPFEWGIIGGLGGAIWNEELGGTPYRNYDGSPVTPTFRFADHVRFEHDYSFDFTFYADW